MISLRSIRATALLAVAGASLVLLTAACRNAKLADSGKPAQTQPNVTVEQQLGPPVRLDVAPPPGVDANVLTLKDNAATQRAVLSYEQAVAQVPQAAPLKEAQAAGEAPESAADAKGEKLPGELPGEPPLAAQRLYAAARDAMRERRQYDAIRQYEAALRLDPNAPKILRALGHAYASTGNYIRAAEYFRQLIVLEPDTPDALYTLGRLAMEQGETDDAISYFEATRKALALKANAPLRESLEALTAAREAAALRQAGYARAALDRYMHYLTLDRQFTTQNGFVAELLTIDRQQPLVLVAVGDLYNQLDAPGQAAQAYAEAQQASGSLAVELLARQLYTALRLNHSDEAIALLTDRISRLGAQQGLLDLVRYLIDQGVPSDQLVASLREVYEQESGSQELALALAQVLPEAQAVALLTEHLQSHAGDTDVFEFLLWKKLLPGNVKAADDGQVDAAIDATLDVMSQSPAYAGSYAVRLVREADDPKRLGERLDARLPGAAPAAALSPTQQADLQVLRGLLFYRLDQLADALDAFEAALDHDPDSMPARLQLIKLLLARGEVERAEKLLAPIAHVNTPEIITLRANVLIKSDRLSEATTVLQQAIRDTEGGTPAMAILLADVQMQQHHEIEAEQVLLSALDRFPTDESLYAVLLAIYQPADGGPSRLNNDVKRQVARLKTRLVRTIPNSRLAQLLRAGDLAADGQVDRAETILKSLLKDNPRDLEARQLLMQLYLRFGRRDDAEAFFQQMYAATPKDRDVLTMGVILYRQLGDDENFARYSEELLLNEPPSQQRDHALARLYLSTSRLQDAADALDRVLLADEVEALPTVMQDVGNTWMAMDKPEQAARRFHEMMRRFPEQGADLSYQLAYLYYQNNDPQRYEAELQNLLKIWPDYAPANNDLGYKWADEDRNLEQARDMIHKAIQADPESGAYWDSMGWVEYKLGNFQEALQWLSKAAESEEGGNPVVRNHLGDALYRAGKPKLALQEWRLAQKALEEFERNLKAQGTTFEEVNATDMIALRTELPAKITAVENDQPAPVAGAPAPAPGSEPASEPAPGSEPAENAPAPGADFDPAADQAEPAAQPDEPIRHLSRPPSPMIP